MNSTFVLLNNVYLIYVWISVNCPWKFLLSFATSGFNRSAEGPDCVCSQWFTLREFDDEWCRRLVSYVYPCFLYFIGIDTYIAQLLLTFFNLPKMLFLVLNLHTYVPKFIIPFLFCLSCSSRKTLFHWFWVWIIQLQRIWHCKPLQWICRIWMRLWLVCFLLYYTVDQFLPNSSLIMLAMLTWFELFLLQISWHRCTI